MKKRKKIHNQYSLKNKMYILINFITLLRLPLTILFVIFVRKYILESEISFGICAIVISLLIFYSDFIDGKLARKNNCVTKIGQSLDIYLDFIYILSGTIIFNYYDLIPVWFTIVVIYKFTEFIVLSKVLNRTTKSVKDDKYFFDKTGGIVSVLYYIIPTITLFFMLININCFNILMMGILVIITILTFAASFWKIKKNI